MNAAVIYLVNHTEQGISDVKKSLVLLRNNYLARYPCDVVCFHEAALTAVTRNSIAAYARIPVIWSEVGFAVPTWIDQSRICTEKPVGYLHMCRFFTHQVFFHPALQQYDYTLRLDTDSEILSPVTVDLFEEARKHNIVYGYVDDTIHDQPQFVAGLKECCDVVAKTDDIDVGRVYYTNIELCQRNWFTNTPWTSLVSVIDSNGGIYYHRWGDAPIRYIGIQLYTRPQDRWVLPVHYRHQVFTYDRRNG